jgi:probable addiction module antidote protein
LQQPNDWQRNGTIQMPEKIYDYDPADHLKTDFAISIFMDDAFESGDAAYIAHALGIVARAKGMTHVARETGLAREQLYKSLSADGNPTLSTLLAVMKSLGLGLAGRKLTAVS